jgi:hypothetical protein
MEESVNKQRRISRYANCSLLPILEYVFSHSAIAISHLSYYPMIEKREEKGNKQDNKN